MTWKDYRNKLGDLVFWFSLSAPDSASMRSSCCGPDLMRSGAFDVLDTEIEAIREPLIQELLSNLQRRLDEVRIGSFEREQVRGNLAEVGLIGESMEMQNLFMQILHAARLSCPVLIS